jgi:uncharacterized RDD family membrane protein YckC
VVFSRRSLLTGVDASAAQKPPVTKTCPQCGCVRPSSVRACNFCDSNFSVELSSHEDNRPSLAPKESSATAQQAKCVSTATSTVREEKDGAWRGELGQRLEAYRARHGKLPSEVAQSKLPFGESEVARRSVAVVEQAPVVTAHPPVSTTGDDDFSFTIAIGRYTPPAEKRDARMMIDVSLPPKSNAYEQGDREDERSKHYGLYPVASMRDRRIAALIDGACLLFAYGGFLALFGSLGGHFTASKLTAAVYTTTLAIVYLQYFALFTTFGGTTPGMMFRGLQVATFSGAPPAPRRLLLRSMGYILSASACFAGFFWAWWDEDGLTWHDRVSRTYLSSPMTRAHMHAPSAAHGR